MQPSSGANRTYLEKTRGGGLASSNIPLPSSCIYLTKSLLMIDNFKGLGNLIVRFLPKDVLSLQLLFRLSHEVPLLFKSHGFFDFASFRGDIAAGK